LEFQRFELLPTEYQTQQLIQICIYGGHPSQVLILHWLAVMHRQTPTSEPITKAYQQKAVLLFFPMTCLVQASDMVWCLKKAVECRFRAFGKSRHPVFLAPRLNFQISCPKSGSVQPYELLL
jgi:hypothetical protein